MIVFLLPIILFIGSCDIRQSDDVLTSNFLTYYTITDDGSNSLERVVIQARFKNRFDDGDTILLADGDIIQVTLDKNAFPLAQRAGNTFGHNYYEKTFSGDHSNKLFKLSLIRNSTDTMTSAPDSSVRLPPAFSILNPNENDSFLSTDVISVSWSVNEQDQSDRSSMIISGSWICDSGNKHTFETSVADNGGYTLDLKTFFYTKNCPTALTLTLKRTRSGTIDSNFISGSDIKATQTRTTRIQIVNG